MSKVTCTHCNEKFEKQNDEEWNDQKAIEQFRKWFDNLTEIQKEEMKKDL